MAQMLFHELRPFLAEAQAASLPVTLGETHGRPLRSILLRLSHGVCWCPCFACKACPSFTALRTGREPLGNFMAQSDSDVRREGHMFRQLALSAFHPRSRKHIATGPHQCRRAFSGRSVCAADAVHGPPAHGVRSQRHPMLRLWGSPCPVAVREDCCAERHVGMLRPAMCPFTPCFRRGTNTLALGVQLCQTCQVAHYSGSRCSSVILITLPSAQNATLWG